MKTNVLNIIKNLLIITIVIFLLLNEAYFERGRFELHRLLIILLGIGEMYFLHQLVIKFEIYSVKNNLTISKRTLYALIFTGGLTILLFAIDRIAEYWVSKYNYEYSGMFILAPGMVLFNFLYEVVDIWAWERENRQNT